MRFLLSLDMKLLEVTSMTEMGGLPQIMNRINPGDFRVGKVGLEFPEICNVKLINQDEVCIALLLHNTFIFSTFHSAFTDWSR